VELVFERADVAGDVRISWVAFEDSNVYPSPL
jgi:hypothetical protein